MWVDHSSTSPYRDHIYAVWTGGNLVFFNYRNGPSGTWRTPIRVSAGETTGTGIGADVTSNEFGDVFVAWADTGSQQLFLARSFDGGTSFAAPLKIASTFGANDIGMPSFAFRRALIYPSIAASRTFSTNFVYAVWTDLSGEAGCTTAAAEPGANAASACKTRIWFGRGRINGTSWAAPIMLNSSASRNDQFNPRLAVDDTTGQIAIVYYDTVGDPRRLKTDLWLQTSDNYGATWSAPLKMTTAPTDETASSADNGISSPFGDQYGDYNGLTGHGGHFFPSWTDRRSGGREEIWTTHIEGPTTCDLGIVLDHSSLMNQLRTDIGASRTRCEDAAYYAEDVVNYFRCGANHCPSGTLDVEPVNFFIDGAEPGRRLQQQRRPLLGEG